LARPEREQREACASDAPDVPKSPAVSDKESVLSATVLRKSYPAIKEAIASMRLDIATLVAEYLDADAEAVENVKLAISEAATSVVRSISSDNDTRHVHVTVARLDVDRLAIIVTDEGYGVTQPAHESALSMGFLVMRDRADSLTLSRSPTGGMQIDMRFALRTRGAPFDVDASSASTSRVRPQVGWSRM
jgi:anti-sigma regulatory factor (Ser/Thr protein kinase)